MKSVQPETPASGAQVAPSPDQTSVLRIRYAEGGKSLDVRLIHAWARGDVEPVSGSSGLKDYVKNQVWSLFEAEPEVDRVLMVRARGPVFCLVRRKGYWFDVTGKQVISTTPAVASAVSATVGRGETSSRDPVVPRQEGLFADCGPGATLIPIPK